MLARLLVVFALCMPSIVQAQPTASELEKSSNPHIRGYATMLASARWTTPSLFVCWENPEVAAPEDLGLVMQAVGNSWEKHSALKFSGWAKCAPVNKGIRILIDDSGPHTKGLGNQLDGKPSGMVLNFKFNNWSPECQAQRTFCISSIAVHEFGHAVGFAHEQNRYDAPGECQQLAQGTSGDLDLTPYDQASVMNYCNEKYNNNGMLSSLDIQALQELYGKPTTVGLAK